MTSRLLSLVLGTVAIAACSTNVEVITGGTASGTSSGTTGSTGGAGGVGGSGTGGDIGFGGAGWCGRTYDRFTYELGIDGAPSIGCSAAQPGANEDVHLQGVVLTSSTTELTFDTCPPNVDCDSDTVYHLKVDAPAFHIFVNPGSFIDIRATVAFNWACVSTLVARTLPEWNGVPNPGGVGSRLLFAGVDGVSTVPDGIPFSLGTTPLGCTPDDIGGCGGGGEPDDYRFDIKSGNTLVSVEQGEIKAFSVVDGGVGYTLTFRNLRSFETGFCDDYWNWAYTVQPAPLD